MNPEPQPTIPNWTARQVILATLFVVAVGLGFWLLFRYRMVILILFTAIVLGTALRPLVEWFVRRGLSPGYGLAFVYVILLLGLATLLILLVPILVDQALDLAVSLPEMYLDLRLALLNSPSLFLRNIGLNLPEAMGLLLRAAPPESEPVDAVTRFIGFSATFLTGFVATLAAFLLTSFWILESERAIRGLLLFAPARYRQQARELIELIESRVGAYLRGQLLLCLIIGLLAFIAYLIIGLPNALTLALIAGVLEAVPVFGPAIGAVPALLIALALDPALAVWILLATVVIQGLENYFLVPRVMNASVGVNPMVTLLALATFTSLLGLPGALLAIPLASVVQVLLNRFVLSADRNGWSAPAGRDYKSALRYEIQDLIGDVRKHLRKKDARSNAATDQVEDAIEALAVELDLLLIEESGE